MSTRPVLVLASNSPRRRELLALGGWPFEVIVSNADESLLVDETPGGYVCRLAEVKARASAAAAKTGQVVLAADTSVVDEDAILGKPIDPLEAKAMLRKLRGRTHQVYTGIATLRVSEGNLLTDLCVTDVPMRAYSEAEIETYVQTGDPLDKAGAYAIQHPHFQPVESMHGCYASVMGLPLCHVTRLLQRMGLPRLTDVPARCQAFLNYECQISKKIMAPV